MRAAKVDKNHADIVKCLRECGASVQSLASIGKGCPDLIAAKAGEVWVIEVKGPKGKLTPDQVEWFSNWRGVVHIVRNRADVLKVMGLA